MDADDLAFIESRLHVVLPTRFKDFMRPFPNDAGHQLQNDCDVLPTNAELFVIAQLGRFNNDYGNDMYELQPELRDCRFMDIGGDGCGNFYCMVGNDANSNELWIWEHDPYNGFTRCNDRLLTDYFGPQWRLDSRTNPFAGTPTNGRIVSRADHPHRSILAPITMDEWQEYIMNDPQLELDELHEMTNPFTKDTIMVRRWPGRATLTINSTSAHITYLHGCLTLSSSPNVTPAHKAKMRQIASDLGAKLY